jgi:hypothetical protein
MPIDAPPPPPKIELADKPRADSPIVDMREQFARRTPQSVDDAERTRAFIDGKIEMIRRDPNMSESDKDRAIKELESKR